MADEYLFFCVIPNQTDVSIQGHVSHEKFEIASTVTRSIDLMFCIHQDRDQSWALPLIWRALIVDPCMA